MIESLSAFDGTLEAGDEHLGGPSYPWRLRLMYKAASQCYIRGYGTGSIF